MRKVNISPVVGKGDYDRLKKKLGSVSTPTTYMRSLIKNFIQNPITLLKIPTGQNDNEEKVTLTIQVDPKTKEQFSKICKGMGKSMSEVVVLLVQDALNKKELIIHGN